MGTGFAKENGITKHQGNMLCLHDALLVVDIQNDFLGGGSLAVPGAEAIIPVLNRYITLFQARNLPIFASRDWHPADHCSFQTYGGPWPVHCVADSEGSSFSPQLGLPSSVVFIYKAVTREKEVYSCFEDTGLAEQLRQKGVQRIFIGGLVTEYCVLSSVKDALKIGFAVFVLQDAIASINVDDGDRAREEMKFLGAKEINVSVLLP